MIQKLNQAYNDPELAKSLARQIHTAVERPVKLMEVCGTHTMAIFRHGIRSLLPEKISLLSGPGCPVCVTAQGDIDAFIQLAGHRDVIVTTFGDLMRVPGSGSSLQRKTAEGADVRVIYSPLDAVNIAQENPSKKVVFLGVGFETTVPAIAAAVLTAHNLNLDNFFIYSAHKTVPAALSVLMSSDDSRIDGFILPGHVSVIIGLQAYEPLFKQFQRTCVITGFEPVDILEGILRAARQIQKQQPQLENAYPRAVTKQGNQKAQQIIQQVFEPCDARWRGIGDIAQSGLRLRTEYSGFDARRRFDLDEIKDREPKNCACGEILMGVKTPPQCALYAKVCNPMQPVGPCMVSSEGTCAAYYRFH
ncbi:MAG: hydrogenase formation protein HypD [Desulfobacteraceae bacterium]|nr:hydrogenase formation protein HypD [Desulfobacteraceae bacterium]